MNEHDQKIEEYKTYTNFGSGVALLSSVIAAASAPLTGGLFLGVAALSSSVAAYSLYRRLEEQKKELGHYKSESEYPLKMEKPIAIAEVVKAEKKLEELTLQMKTLQERITELNKNMQKAVSEFKEPKEPLM